MATRKRRSPSPSRSKSPRRRADGTFTPSRGAPKRRSTARKRAPARRVRGNSGMDAFTRAYVEAALWSSTDDEGNPMDANYGVSDINKKTLAKMVKDCAAFQRANARDLEHQSDSQSGHDFWLTRNGHGAGFWDRDLPKAVGKRLTDAAHDYGSFDLYVGDDGTVYG